MRGAPARAGADRERTAEHPRVGGEHHSLVLHGNLREGSPRN
jgi:hypothetical protein